ncbi:hypothetical protein AXF42_Ash002428 [Apostasia shenzhenica]|uniref:DUF632 domain-containing protein n=1 Tax=Apostasia shenzhenica TaxID=1088818 RepID=A0A2I0ANK8_9ASPA|nr:hypothetical protein AXF42_Ash002428 [Apostasia shenzhenica]
MGCGSSRADETGLVVLCRQRTALIREAADCRYGLAAAHDAYFRALADVGDALVRFAREGIAPASPVIVLPPSGKGGAGGNGSGGSSVTPLSHSLSDSHLHISSDSDESEGEDGGGGKGGEPSASLSPQPPRISSAGPSPSYYFMKKSSTEIPTMVYGEPYTSAYGGYSNFYYEQSVSPARPNQPAIAASPPSPPPPHGSAWDFFDPFNSYDQFLPNYFAGQYSTASVESSPSSSEVRAREGIPDLEDETEPKPVATVKKGKMVAEDFGTKGIPSREKEEMVEKESKGSSGEKTSMSSSAGKGSENESVKKGIEGSSGISSGEQGSSSKKKGVNFEDESSLMSHRSGPSDGSLTAVEGTRDVVEVLAEIKKEFQSAIVCSEEVSKMLEVGKTKYRSRNKAIRVITSRILGTIGFRLSFRRPSKHRRHSTMTSRSRHVEFEKLITIKSANLSSTLEKLYVWEKKLFNEVKAEERLRAMYDKKCRTLKSLDDRGAEPHKITSVRASIRMLRTKISIAITSVDAISRRMYVIMDDELQPQLAKLIQGLTTMWKLLLACHQKQLNAIIHCKSYNLTIKTQDSSPNITMHLQLKLLDWYACFDELISTHKAFITSLNGWLMKWLPEDREVTSDGMAPFSPRRIGAPSVFVLSNDWFQVVNSWSEADVKAAIASFAETIHRLWESQDEEQRRKHRVDYLSKDYSGRLKNLQKEHGNLDHVHDENKIAFLDSMKRKLDEARAKHDDTVRQVDEVVSSSLRAGLIPIFQSLGGFASEALQSYEGLRLPESREAS